MQLLFLFYLMKFSFSHSVCVCVRVNSLKYMFADCAEIWSVLMQKFTHGKPEIWTKDEISTKNDSKFMEASLELDYSSNWIIFNIEPQNVKCFKKNRKSFQCTKKRRKRGKKEFFCCCCRWFLPNEHTLREHSNNLCSNQIGLNQKTKLN